MSKKCLEAIYRGCTNDLSSLNGLNYKTCQSNLYAIYFNLCFSLIDNIN